MYMTFFDSKRYYSAPRMMPFYKTRSLFLPTNMEQQQTFNSVFQHQSVRYSCLINGPIFEEHFELIDGASFLYRHRLMKPASYTDYLTKLLDHYGYGYGGVLKNMPKESLEKTIQHALLKDMRFTYEQDILVYRKKETEFYIAIAVFQDQNFALRIFEKEDYESQHKDSLIETIHTLLAPLLLT